MHYDDILSPSEYYATNDTKYTAGNSNSKKFDISQQFTDLTKIIDPFGNSNTNDDDIDDIGIRYKQYLTTTTTATTSSNDSEVYDTLSDFEKSFNVQLLNFSKNFSSNTKPKKSIKKDKKTPSSTSTTNNKNVDSKKNKKMATVITNSNSNNNNSTKPKKDKLKKTTSLRHSVSAPSDLLTNVVNRLSRRSL